MVDKYCPLCTTKVAKLASDSSMKKGAVIICRACYDRLESSAASLMQQRTKAAYSSIPDFLAGFR